MSSAAHPQEVSSFTVPKDYKESVVKNPLEGVYYQLVTHDLSNASVNSLTTVLPAPTYTTSHMEKEQIEKFKRYEVECRKHLMSKYFSDKTIFGGNIFDVKMTEDGETIKMSRFPGYQSYADPANFNDGSSSKSNPTSETPSNVAKGKQTSKEK